MSPTITNASPTNATALGTSSSSGSTPSLATTSITNGPASDVVTLAYDSQGRLSSASFTANSARPVIVVAPPQKNEGQSSSPFKDYIAPIVAVLGGIASGYQLWKIAKQSVTEYWHVKALQKHVRDCGIPRTGSYTCMGNTRVEEDVRSLLQTAQGAISTRVNGNGHTPAKTGSNAQFPNVQIEAATDDGHILLAKRFAHSLDRPLIVVDCARLILRGSIPTGMVKYLESEIERVSAKHKRPGAVLYLKDAQLLKDSTQKDFVAKLAAHLAEESSPLWHKALVVASIAQDPVPQTPVRKENTPASTSSEAFQGLVRELGRSITYLPPYTQQEIFSLLEHQVNDKLTQKLGAEATLTEEVRQTLYGLAGAFPEFASASLAYDFAGALIDSLSGRADNLTRNQTLKIAMEKVLGQVLQKPSAPNVVDMNASMAVAEALAAHVAERQVFAISVQSRSKEQSGAYVVRERLPLDDVSLSRPHVNKLALLQELFVLLARIEGTDEAYSGCKTSAPAGINHTDLESRKIALHAAEIIRVEQRARSGRAQPTRTIEDDIQLILTRAQETAREVLALLNRKAEAEKGPINAVVDQLSPESGSEEQARVSHGRESIGSEAFAILERFQPNLVEARRQLQEFLENPLGATQGK